MLAEFLSCDDKRLDETYDFEIQTIGEDGDIEDINWEQKTTFNKVFDGLETRYGSFEVSVLDYGDELQGTVTLHKKSARQHYKILMT